MIYSKCRLRKVFMFESFQVYLDVEEEGRVMEEKLGVIFFMFFKMIFRF